MLCGSSDLAVLFSLMHDGQIVAWSGDLACLRLRVEIDYLTRRIRPESRSFEIELMDVRDLRFSTWPNDQAAVPRVITDLVDVFGAPLDILSGEVHGDGVRVICNQPSPKLDYCGGEMDFSATAAVVRDDMRKQWSRQELTDLAEAYWSEWERQNEKRK